MPRCTEVARPAEAAAALCVGFSGVTRCARCRGLAGGDMEAWLDLRPFMFRSPLLVQGGASLTRALVLFRGLGLRHLLVAPQDPRSVGIITRKARPGRAVAPWFTLPGCCPMWRTSSCSCGTGAPRDI